MSNSLRSKVIRLAYQNTSLRPHLLPLLSDRTASRPSKEVLDLLNEYFPGGPVEPDVAEQGQAVIAAVNAYLGGRASQDVMPTLHNFLDGAKDLRKKLLDSASLAERKREVERYFNAILSEARVAERVDKTEGPEQGADYSKEIKRFLRAVSFHQDFVLDSLEQFSSLLAGA